MRLREFSTYNFSNNFCSFIVNYTIEIKKSISKPKSSLMKTKYFILILLLFPIKFFAQTDLKTAYQKNKYELATSYYKKGDYKNALNFYSLTSKIKPENEIGIESLKKIDTLRTILRKKIMDKVVGTWKISGEKPLWSVDGNTNNSSLHKLVEVNPEQILFYEFDTQTNTKKLIRTEKLAYYNKDQSDDLFSAIILSDGTIWECLLSENESILHIINIANKTEKGIEVITHGNSERFLSKID